MEVGGARNRNGINAPPYAIETFNVDGVRDENAPAEKATHRTTRTRGIIIFLITIVVVVTLIAVAVGAGLGVVLSRKTQDTDECLSSPCHNGANCNDNVNGFTCTCANGWMGIHCEIDTDECLSSPCHNGANCNDNVNGFTCTCANGWMGIHCEIDIDECQSNPCQNQATCNDLISGFTCTCANGRTGTHCEEAVYYEYSFITGFMASSSVPVLYTLLIASPEEMANITVSIPELSIVYEHHELKGGMLTLEYSTPIGVKAAGVHITADRPVMLFAGNFDNRSSGGSLVPPESSLGTDYIISTYTSFSNEQFLIVSTEDRTLITMNIKSVMVNITLNRMDTYLHVGKELSGSMIFSSAPVYVLSGNSCARIPFFYASCDYIAETMPPISSLGNLHVVSYMFPRPLFRIGIVAPFNNTSVTISDANGTIIAMHSRVEDVTFSAVNKTISVEATHPVLVTQYGYGSHGDCGDSSMMTIPDVNHFGHLYHFVVPSNYTSTVVVVMTSLYAISDLLLDDVVFNATKTITAKTTGYDDYLILYGAIAPGYHKLARRARTAVSFGAWIYGCALESEYAWSLGHT